MAIAMPAMCSWAHAEVQRCEGGCCEEQHDPGASCSHLLGLCLRFSLVVVPTSAVSAATKATELGALLIAHLRPGHAHVLPASAPDQPEEEPGQKEETQHGQQKREEVKSSACDHASER